MNIYESITKIMEEVPAIGKDKVNKVQGFKFRGIDDVMNALQPLLSKNERNFSLISLSPNFSIFIPSFIKL